MIDLTTMTPEAREALQRRAIRWLLDMTDENGRGYYSLTQLGDELGGLTPAQLYDNNTNTGLLWDLGRFGEALIDVLPPDYIAACVNRDCEADAKRFARFR